MRNLYDNVSDKILKKSPFVWIIGWHKFLPLILFLMLLAVIAGFIIPTEVYDYSIPYLNEISFFLGFLAFIVFVLFLIRQVKFNSFRIHHKIPYSNSISFYFHFVLFVLLLALIPFIPKEVYNFRVIDKVNTITSNFNKDYQYLNDNLFFFYTDTDNYYGIDEEIFNDKDSLIVKPNVRYFDNHIIVYDYINTFTYYNYHFNDHKNKFPLKISNTEALQRIADFLEIANRYGIKTTENNPKIIFNKRKEFVFNKVDNVFSLLRFKSETSPRIILSDYGNLLSHYKRYNTYRLHDEEVLYTFLFIAVILALLLWIFISVPKTDFGYAILAGAIILVFVGVMVGLLSIISNSFMLFLILSQLVLLAIFLVAFLGDNNTLLTRIMTILSQISIPIQVGLVYGFYFDFSHNFPQERIVSNTVPIVLLVTLVLTVFLFKNIYRNSRMLPR